MIEGKRKVQVGDTLTFADAGTFTVIVEPKVELKVEEDKVGDFFEHEGELYMLARHGGRYVLLAFNHFLCTSLENTITISSGATFWGFQPTVPEAFGTQRNQFTKIGKARAKKLVVRMFD